MHPRSTLVRAAAGAALLAISASVGAASAAGPTTWTAMAGTGDASGVAANKFYPTSLTIDAGDTITWRAAGNAHVIGLAAAGQPLPAPDSPQALQPAGGSTYDGTTYSASGLLLPLPPGVPVPAGAPPGSVASYSLTFPTAGTYQFHCIIHPSMVGTITVQAAGSAYPQTQAALDAAASTAEAADIATGHALEAAYKPSVTTSARGSKTYHYAAGLGQNDIEILRFITANTALKVGDSIEWTNYSSGESHSVSFGPEPQGPSANGPSGGATYGGTGFVSSGLYMGAPLPGPHTYTLTFTKPGTYHYFCVLHDIVGMVGSVTVSAGAVATLPPTSTLPASSAPAGSDSLPWALALLASVAALGGIGSYRFLRSRVRG